MGQILNLRVCLSSGMQSTSHKPPKKRKFDVEPGPDLSTKSLSNLREIVEALITSARPLGLDHSVDSGSQLFVCVGTLHSGTDAPFHVLSLFGMLENDAGEQVFTTINSFACGMEPFKQGFLKRNSKPRLLFARCSRLYQDWCEESISATMTCTPRLFLYVL